MGGKIDCYLDCTSFYAYLAFKHLLKNREILKSYDVEVEFHPVFLGGINVLSGNKPPWTLPAKAAYTVFDGDRAKKYFEAQDIRTPEFFPILSILPQRAMLYIKANYPNTKFEAAFYSLFPALWIPPQSDLSKPANLRNVLLQNFTPAQADEIITAAGTPEVKQQLTDITKMVVEKHGAFGCPWYCVTNSQGKAEPFFGSDRFHFMWEFLGLPWQDIKILSKEEAAAAAKARL